MANGSTGEISDTTESASTKYLGWRIFSGAAVVTLALAAVVGSLSLVLDNYDGEGSAPATTPNGATVRTSSGAAVTTSSDTASVSASSVVAVLTPVMAGIVGIAGLFFGISATGSSRGRSSEAQQHAAEMNAKAVAEALPKVVKATEQTATAAKQASRAAKRARKRT